MTKWLCSIRIGFLSAPILLVLAMAPMRSHAQLFSYDFDSWSGSGNGFDTPVTDDFNDGMLLNWTIANGTAIESGGVLNLRDPGSLYTAHFPTFDLNSFLSHVVRNLETPLSDGNGDFTVTTTIKQTLIPVDDYFGLNVGTAAPHYFVSLVLQNFGPEIGGQAEFEAGLSAALYIITIDSIDSTTEATASNVASVRTPFDPVDMTGDIHLRLDFNDTTNEFTGSFSTDGGSSFTTIGNLPMVAGWIGLTGLSADPRQLAPPVPTFGPVGLAILLGVVIGMAYWKLRGPVPSPPSAARICAR